MIGTFHLGLLVLSSVLQAQQAKAQCVADCGCTVIQACCLEVVENQEAGTVVGRDNSARLLTGVQNFTNPVFTLSQPISSPGASEAIGVNFSTGEFFTLRALDREGETFTTHGMTFEQSGHCIQVGILVVDGDDITKRFRYILNIRVADINDNPPRFRQDTIAVHVPETTTDQPRLECSGEVTSQLMATDIDDFNAQINYRVEGTSLFMINNTTVPCVVNAHGVVLDRDTGPANYSFILVAVDSSNSSLSSRTYVTYILEDVNDNSPIFENSTYKFSIVEDAKPSTVIGQLRADDIDLGNVLMYSIDDNYIFSIDEGSGNLTLVGDVDAESSTTYTLTVYATDGINSARSQVIITILDANEPANVSFSDSSRNITENMIHDIVTSITIRDYDLTYRDNTIQVIGNDAFDIEHLGPSIFLRQVLPVDYELNSTVQLTLKTTELGEPDNITQHITYILNVVDVNDNPPTLTRTQFSIPEGAGDRVIVDLSQYVADADSGEKGLIQKYELVSVSKYDMNRIDFTGSLNNKTGILRSSAFEIDREVQVALHFVVNITDRGEPSLSNLLNFTVEIADINDNSPEFEQATYAFHLLENQPTESLVGQMVAYDLDYLENGTVIYSITQLESPFVIHQRTGQILSAAVFDRENVGSYEVIVEARDNGRLPMNGDQPAKVTIFIDDVNDNDPVFNKRQETNFTFYTSTKTGSEIATLEASDIDEEPYNVIIYSLEPTSGSTFFSVGPLGKIELTQPVPHASSFLLNISAFNSGREEHKDTIVITITALDPPKTALIAGVVGAACALLLLLITMATVVIVCVHCRNKKLRNRTEISDNSNIVELRNMNANSLADTTVAEVDEKKYYYNKANIYEPTKNKLSQ